MKRPVAIATIVVAMLSACSGPSPGAPSEADSAALMAAALTELVSEDHTFGEGPPPFTTYLIESSTVEIGAGETEPARGARRPLTEGERAAVEDAISGFGEVRWISDPDQWVGPELEPSIEGSVILGVGAPVLDGDDALVPVSLWCGGTCGTWLTYRLEGGDGVWRVVGIEGPVSIS